LPNELVDGGREFVVIVNIKFSETTRATPSRHAFIAPSSSKRLQVANTANETLVRVGARHIIDPHATTLL